MTMKTDLSLAKGRRLNYWTAGVSPAYVECHIDKSVRFNGTLSELAA
jgi:hypothetical protein